MAKYPYFSPDNKTLKPWIKISLGYRETHKVSPGVIALIDSGADVCFCKEDIGIWLGIKFSKKEPTIFTTANRSTFRAQKEAVTIYACGKKYDCLFYFTNDLPHETPIILGQLGFFDRFKITFDLKNKEMEIL
ncbi:MAG: hypothetical protein A3H50_03575 [Candidatus Levybacteria bacterium RIFCSPLOWO2_02_FULL_37_10]|nr:MAG: hypothetical protein A2860_02350 [Candidatus Levybacteria bacterium RIFCSPHIGHO2_01_FULL_37_33]OGH15797.1 MAG: hypothetical protein A3C97_00955 [Candidatus Levybacteria bacterium RIFCSPHIGHO2_02_FULL_37_11]OGH30018.1 MAG: hypothetical protein A3F30_02350 [Candidatus Levybacteria bacterium RIFCSPHIGHO2_12_FULL_37_12]OGH43138.1 MAG: hypothetical protein A3H50_03575 [Candidatus Levybacteria bacterium RIFCSPLOWO2_02_FULL_37_10]